MLHTNPRAIQVLLADWVVGPGAVPIFEGALAFANGEILRLWEGHAAARRWAEGQSAQVQRLPAGVLGPGWVNAHSHLELTGLSGRISCEGGFPRWIARLMEAKRHMGLADYRMGVQSGAQRMLQTGTTTVGDIDSQAVGGSVDSPIRMRLYREALDAFRAHRTELALESVAQPLALRERMAEGLAPHASFTVSPALMQAMSRLAAIRSVPVTVHWSETRAEVDWLVDGTGPLLEVMGTSPRRSGLDILEEAGLLAPHVSLAHGNWPAPGEEQRIARAGATIVHCPGSHLYFEREPFPLQRYLEVGARVALGTDSQASNLDLDMGREVALLRGTHPALDASLAYRMATENGAFAVGLAGQVGRLQAGWRADLVLFEAHNLSQNDVLERLTRENLPVAHVWVDGERVA